MPSLGETLRQERESRNIPLHEISLATRISETHLEALEADDLKALPGTVFNKGYVRAYADYLGVDPAPLIDAYVAEEAAMARRGEMPESPDVLVALRESVERQGGPAARPRRYGPALAGIAAAVVVIAAGWLLIARLVSGGGEPPAPDAAAGGTGETGVARPGRPAPQTTAPAREGAEPAAPRAAEGPGGTPAESGAEAARAPTVAPAATEETVAAGTPGPGPATGPEASAASTAAPASGSAPPAKAIPSPPVTVGGTQTILEVPEFGVGTGVARRSLVGRGERFPQGTEVWFWTRVTGGRDGDRLRHVWLHDGTVAGEVELRIGGAHWRTYSRHLLPRGATGSWAVEARDQAGNVLARVEFVCE